MDGATLGTAYVQVVPSTEGIAGELSSAFDTAGTDAGVSSGKKFGDSFGGALGAAMKTGGIAVAGVAAGVTALGGAFAKSAGDVASYGDDVDKMSQKIGISSQAYQEWDAILQHSGTSMSAMRPAMKTLFTQAQNGSDAFQKLGMSQEEVANMSREDLFAATITALQGVTDENEKATLAQELLGRGATEMGALLNTSAEDTEEMRKKVHELGGVMSDDAVKASAKYQDSLQDMQTAINGAKMGIMSNFLPAMTGVMDGIGMLFSGDSKKGIGMIKDGLNQFISKLSETIPKVIETGTQILLALVDAIVQNLPQIVKAGTEAILQLAKGIADALPQLIPAAVDAVLAIVDGLIDNIDMIVDAALQLIIGLADGLIKAIPKIIEKIPTIIQKIFDALVKSGPKIAEAGVKLLTSLVQNLPAIIATIIKAVPEIIKNLLSGFASAVSSFASAGVKLFTSIVQNLPTIISNIVGKIPEILSSIIEGFKDGISDMIQVGKDLLTGLAKGIVEGVKGVIDKAKQAAGKIMDSIKKFFGVASPSKEFAKIGGFLMEGLAEGITDGMDVVDNAMGDLNHMIQANGPEDITAMIGNDYSGMSGMNGSVRIIDGININVYGAPGQDVNALADAVAYRLQTLVDRKAAVWA